MASPYLNVHNSANGRKWHRREASPRQVEQMVQQYDMSPLLAELLVARDVSVEEAGSFLTPSLKQYLPDPYVLKDMETAASRLAQAVEDGETIGIFGDYDVDGTTSSALLYRYFTALGIKCFVHLPDRQAEGYGPNIDAFRRLAEQGASLLLTVDCGANAHGVLGQAEKEGMEVIVLDHHGMERGVMPPAIALVNPNRPDDLSGLTNLSAGGVVFMTLVAVNRLLRQKGFFDQYKEPNLLAWLDLVALSLVCDVMPLKGLTRVLVRQGLRVLQNFDDATAGNLGIRALAAEAGASGGAQASHFGFSVGPRINAAGRIGHARMAFDILTTDDMARATELAHRLQTLNGHRQDVEKAVLDAALSQGEAKGGRGMDTPLVVAAEGWHPGVIGIVAGRLKERFDRPAIVISFEGEEGKGSGRSISGVDLGATIAQAVAEGVIQGGGGHPMAAGLSLKKDQLAAFETYLRERLAPHIAAARAHQAFYVDGQVRLNGLTREFCDALQGAGPFGNGNPEPRFVIEDVCLAHLRVLKDKHIACSLKDKMGRTGRAIAFGCIGQPLGDLLLSVQEGGFVHLAGRVKPDDWRGGNAGQFQIEDAALVSEVPSE